MNRSSVPRTAHPTLKKLKKAFKRKEIVSIHFDPLPPPPIKEIFFTTSPAPALIEGNLEILGGF